MEQGDAGDPDGDEGAAARRGFVSPADEARLGEQGWDELRRRARRGIYVHLPLWLLVAGQSGLFATAPRFVAINAAIFGANVAVRRWQIGRREIGRVPWVFLALLLSNALHWGVLSAMALGWPPLEATAWPLWVATSSIAAGGTMGLAISHRVRWGYPLAAYLPVAVALLATPSAPHLLLVATGCIGGYYLVSTSRVIHDDYWAAARSRAELEASRRRFEHLSFTDALTQVPNRLWFEHCLAREWQRAMRAGRELSVLMVDIDHFKLVNDAFGHAAGDASLQTVARTLSAALKRGDDLIARYGGEEFIVLLPDTGAGAAGEIGERLRAAVEALALLHDGRALRLSCSVGIATARPDGRRDAQPGPTGLIAAADKALYRAKRDGRNRVAIAEAPVEA